MTMKAHFGLAKMQPSDGRKPHFGAFACAVDPLFGLRFLIRFYLRVYMWDNRC
uniref:Uncharacterized protein n=1 Tax=Arundo donax TaxID=35708 RepID=A0A0A9HI26_ARUDO